MSAWIMVAVSGLILWGMILRAWDSHRRDFNVLAVAVGVIPAFLVFAAGVLVASGRF